MIGLFSKSRREKVNVKTALVNTITTIEWIAAPKKRSGEGKGVRCGFLNHGLKFWYNTTDCKTAHIANPVKIPAVNYNPANSKCVWPADIFCSYIKKE